MSTPDPPPNVKIYDRPERKTPNPLLLVIAVIVLLAIGLLIYKFVLHPAAAPVAGHVGFAAAAMFGGHFPSMQNLTQRNFYNCGIEQYIRWV